MTEFSFVSACLRSRTGNLLTFSLRIFPTLTLDSVSKDIISRILHRDNTSLAPALAKGSPPINFFQGLEEGMPLRFATQLGGHSLSMESLNARIHGNIFTCFKAYP